MSGAFGFFTKKTEGRTLKGLTASQVIILEAAANSPTRSVRFLDGDRKGTRIVSYSSLGTPHIRAYCTPEIFLRNRGLIENGNDHNTYRITDAGLAALSKPNAPGRGV